MTRYGDESMTEIQTKYHRSTGEGSGLQDQSKLGKVTFEPVLKFELKLARQAGRGVLCRGVRVHVVLRKQECPT